jgi:hypothetical protein
MPIFNNYFNISLFPARITAGVALLLSVELLMVTVHPPLLIPVEILLVSVGILPFPLDFFLLISLDSTVPIVSAITMTVEFPTVSTVRISTRAVDLVSLLGHRGRRPLVCPRLYGLSLRN